MNISHTRLRSHLAKGPASAYLVLNNESILLSEDRDMIRQALACDERQFFFVDQDFNASTVLAEARSGSLFSERLLLEFVCAEPLTATSADQLTKITAAAGQAGHYVLVASAPPIRRGKWVDRLTDTFIVVTHKPIPFERMPGWIKARAQHIKIQLDSEAAELIATLTEGNLDMAARELEKLKIVYGSDQRIDIASAHTCLTDQTRDNLFSLREAMAAGDCVRVIRAIRNLKATKEAPALITWALAEEGQALLTLLENKRQPWGLFGNHLINLKKMARRVAYADAKAYLTAVAPADWIAKGLLKSDPWVRFERLATAFALLARRNSLEKALLS